MKRQLEARLSEWPSGGLTLALLGVAVVLAFVALRPGALLLKAAVLAWVVLP